MPEEHPAGAARRETTHRRFSHRTILHPSRRRSGTLAAMGTALKQWAAGAAVVALLASGCAGAPASAHDRDMKACQKLATWISEGQDPDAYPDVMTYVMGEAQDKVLRDELDELRAERIGGSAEDWATQLEFVAYRCLELYESGQEEL